MDVTITTDGERILADIPYHYGGREQGPVYARKVSGGRWHKDSKRWRYPLSPEKCHDFRRVFGKDLVVSNSLADWYRAEQSRRMDLERLRAGEVGELQWVPETTPLLWEALQNRPFQLTGTAFMVNGRQVCLGDEPRLGKTYQALAALVETGVKRVLIACPRTATRTVWSRKLNELYPQMMPFVAQGSREEREQVIRAFEETPYGMKALIINKEMIRVVRMYQCRPTSSECTTWARVPGQRNMVPVINGVKGWPESKIKPGSKYGCQSKHDHRSVYYPEWPQLFDKPWDAIVLDECHHALASTKNIQSDGISQIRMGAVRLPVVPNAVKLALSGTPFRADLAKAWGVLNWLRPDEFSSFWRYAEDLFGVDSSGYGNVVNKQPKSKAAFQNVLRPYYLARKKSEVAPDLPPVDIVEVKLEMEGEQAEAYRRMVKMAEADLENGKIYANGVLAELTRMKQLACSYGKFSAKGEFTPARPSNKLEWLDQFLEEMKDATGKVVIVSQFTKLIKVMVSDIRKAKWKVVTITGEDGDAARDHAQDEFLHGSARVAVINVFAGGEAIDLSSADTMIFMDEPWTDDAIQQAENRIQNLAKKQKLTIYKLRSTNTIDDRIAGMTAEQRRLLLAGNPGVLAEVTS